MLAIRVPVRFKKATLNTLDAKQFEPVMDYSRRLLERKREGVGLLLSGPSGVGKSWAIAALTRYAATYYAKKGMMFDYEFITAAAMFDALPPAGFSPREGDELQWDPRRQRSWMRTFFTVPWLVINDLGKEERRSEKQHEQACYKLGRILRARSENMLVTHVTTNLPLVAKKKGDATFEKVYGESITSLCAEMMRSYHINGEDRRRKK